MDVKQGSFVSRLFCLCDEIWHRFGHDSHYSRPRQTNVCYLVRVIFVWAPLVLVAHIAFIAFVVFSILVAPILLFGWDYGWFWLWTVVAVATVTCLVLGVKRVWRGAEAATGKLANTDTVRVARSWWRGVKDRICPIINFQE